MHSTDMLRRVKGLVCLLTIALTCTALWACGEDQPADQGSEALTQDMGQDSGQDMARPDLLAEDMGQPEPEDMSQPEPEDMGQPDIEDEPDVEDEPDMPEEDLPPEDMGTECVDDTWCSRNYRCLDNICTLFPIDRYYSETNYILEEPSILTNVVSTIKGIFQDTGFFMTHFAERDGDDLIVYYGGADRVEINDEGPNLYAWQVPERLPSFRVSRVFDREDPLRGDTWQSEVFTYQLVALFGDDEPRSGLSFFAEQTQVTMIFNEELSEITDIRLEGYLTREEAEQRSLDIADNCLFSLALCPGYDCNNDEPLLTVSDVIDCNAYAPDSDINPDIEGNDAYRVVIFIQSDEVYLQRD